jgi:hypothetical protein
MGLAESESLHAVRINEPVRKAKNVEDLKSVKGVLKKIIDNEALRGIHNSETATKLEAKRGFPSIQ